MKYSQEKISAYGLTSTIIETGWLDFEEVGEALQDCAIGLITKTTTPNNILGGPAIKLFNYCIYGLAIVDVNLPESTRFLNKISAGISVKTRTVEHIYKALKRLIEDRDLLKHYCKKAYESRRYFDWEKEADKLLRFYEYEVLNDAPLYIR